MDSRVLSTDWRGIGIVYFAGIVASLALLKASPAAPALRSGLGLSLSQIAWVSSVFTAMTVVSGVFVGRWAAQTGARNLLLAGLLILLLASAATLAVTDARWLLTSRLVEGVGFVLIVVSAPALMAGLAAPHHTRLVMGIWSTWLPAGGVLVMLGAPFLLAIAGWQAVWLGSTVLALLAALLMITVPGLQRGAVNTVGFREALANAQSWLLALCFAFFTMQLYAVLIFTPTYLVQLLSFSLSRAPQAASVILVMAGVGGFFGGALLHRGVRPNLFMAFYFVGIAGLIPLMLLNAAQQWVGLALPFYGLLAGCIPACIYAQAPAAASSAPAIAVVLGLIMAGNGLGILVGPPLVAEVIEATGNWQLASLIPVAACGFGVFSVWSLSRR